MAQHTPGPWNVYEFRESHSGRHTAFVFDNTPKRIANLPYTDKTAEEQKANAVLIANAPDMEAACLTVADELSEYLPNHEKPTFAQMQAWIHHLRAALPEESEEPKP